MMKSQHKKFLVILLAGFWLCFSPQLIDMALSASVSSEQETIVRENNSSISNLEDEAGNVWEFIVEQEANDTYLRLIRCHLFQLDHNHPLQFSDRDRVLFEAKDLYTPESSAFYVANYSIKDILPQLPTDRILDLSFYLTGDKLNGQGLQPKASLALKDTPSDNATCPDRGCASLRRVHLKIPPEVIVQWQKPSKIDQQGSHNSVLYRIPFLLAQNPNIQLS